MELQHKESPELTILWALEDYYPEIVDIRRKTEKMRWLVAIQALEDDAIQHPDAYSVWAELMEARNNVREDNGLVRQGQCPGEVPININLAREQRRKT